MDQALVAVRAERMRQIDIEWRHPSGDDGMGWVPLLLAARAYVEERPDLWPWDVSGYKPKNRRRDLVRAGALVLAGCEVMVRAMEFARLGEGEALLRDILAQLARLMPARAVGDAVAAG